MFIINFIFGLAIAAVGVAGIRYNHQIVQQFGNIAWIRRHLGPGAEFLLFQLLALLVIVFGLLMMVSLHDNLLEFLLSPLTNLFNT